jgi:light-regulated signal transduction histidine kinase (bacteriophytochrome)
VLNEEGKNNIEKIQSSCKRMQDLIQDILTFSTLTMDRRQFEKSDLKELVKDVLVEMDGYVHEKNANISVGDLPSMYVNPVLMRPLFQNLINNSIKYSRTDVDPVIRIRSEYGFADEGVNNSKKHNKYCRIIVEDNGIGFDQVYAEQIFGMFKRLHTKNQYHGTGIGLAICKKIAEEHNGYIFAISKLNEGSTFIVSLPMHEE